ncbi:MAG: hypothetical protein JKY96_04700, partial [Phycisphaerales bacterium]|nr:hypothetical protein [Phycisphaerales bacterium]
GFREWGVGLAAKKSGYAMQAGIGADLINRIVETIWVIPIGFSSSWWVARRFERVTAANNAELVIQRSAETPSQE